MVFFRLLEMTIARTQEGNQPPKQAATLARVVCSVLFCSVLFCSVLFCSVLFCHSFVPHVKLDVHVLTRVKLQLKQTSALARVATHPHMVGATAQLATASAFMGSQVIRAKSLQGMVVVWVCSLSQKNMVTNEFLNRITVTSPSSETKYPGRTYVIAWTSEGEFDNVSIVAMQRT